MSEDKCHGAFHRLCEIGRSKHCKLVYEVDIDDVCIGLDPQSNTVELLQSAQDKQKESETYQETGLFSIRDMSPSVFCYCKCFNDIARVLQKEDLQQCTFCLWHYHVCHDEVGTVLGNKAFVCSTCQRALNDWRLTVRTEP